MLCPLPENTGQGYLLVTPGSIPLHSAPGIPDPNQDFCLVLVQDLDGEWVKVKGIGSGGGSVPSLSLRVGCSGQTHVLQAGHRVGVSSHQHPLGHGLQLALTGDLQSREAGRDSGSEQRAGGTEDRGYFFKIKLDTERFHAPIASFPYL